jgi:hypothetical protein
MKMGKVIDFNTKQEIIIKPPTIEDEFIEELILLLSTQPTKELLQEILFSKWNLTKKQN